VIDELKSLGSVKQLEIAGDGRLIVTLD